MFSFLLGLLIAVVGGLIAYYSHSLIEMFGRIPWADANLGGTAQAYILVSFVVMIVGFCVMFGIIDFSTPASAPSL